MLANGIMAKRKYTKSGEEPKAYECTTKKCKWKGTDEEKLKKRTSKWGSRYEQEYVCPICGNNTFYGLLEAPAVC